jgi:hypothetical protein
MTRDTTTENRVNSAVDNSDADKVMGFAVLGCLVAGSVGILKAMSMESGTNVLLCLLGSVAAFGTVLYFCLRRD